MCRDCAFYKWFIKWSKVGLLFGIIFLVWHSCGGLDAIIGDTPDKFLSLSALFAGLAFAGMICTLIFQIIELKATRVATQTQAEVGYTAPLSRRKYQSVASKGGK